MEKIERLAQRRRILLMVSAGAFLAWQIPLMDSFSQWQAGSASLISLAGFLIWAAALIAVFVWGRAAGVRDPDARAALEDELTQANRARAFSFAYWVMLVGAAGLLALSQFQPVTATEVAHIIVVLGVAAPLFRFALLERG